MPCDVDGKEPVCQSPTEEASVSKPALDNTLKPCCACPETRQQRDDCVLKWGEENCQGYIEAHRACLRAYGFIV